MQDLNSHITRDLITHKILGIPMHTAQYQTTMMMLSALWVLKRKVYYLALLRKSHCVGC